MNITVYTGFSKEVNSTKQPSGGTNVSCVLKDDTSIIHPAFKLQGVGYDVNYVKWDNRYYFVDDIVSLSNNIKEIRCSVDALATYKTQIGASSQYVIRSSSAYDEYVSDGMYPAKSKVSISSSSLSGINLVGTGTYVIGIVSKDSSQGVAYYALTGSQFRDLMAFMFSDTWLDAPITELSKELQKELVNPFQYIASVNYYPFDLLDGASGSDLISFGYWDATNCYGLKLNALNRVKTFPVTVTLPKHPQASSRGKYLNGSPFTSYEVFLYVFGSFSIDPIYLIDVNSIRFTVIIDIFTGGGDLVVTPGSSGGAPILEMSAQCSIPIQISQISSGIVDMINNPMSLLATGSVGLLSGSLGLFSQGLGAYSNVLNATQSALSKLQSKGAQGSLAGWMIEPYLISTFYEIVDEDNEHNGRPLMKRRTINTLSGFIMIENPDVDISGTTYEKDQIIQYMRSGFYYE